MAGWSRNRRSDLHSIHMIRGAARRPFFFAQLHAVPSLRAQRSHPGQRAISGLSASLDGFAALTMTMGAETS